jgi:hypothetical protein
MIRTTEKGMQIAVADALRVACASGWLWTHFPAGELRHPAVAGQLKAMGLNPGWPDIMLLSPLGLFHALELKNGNKPLSTAQEAFRDACVARRVPWAVARSVDEALRVLTRWGAISGLRVAA